MKYLGSKRRIAEQIIPIMLLEAKKNGTETWIEPFVGGANVIDKVPQNFTRIGYDINPHLIQSLIGIRDGIEYPEDVSETYYKSLFGNPPDKVTSLIRFGCSFGGKFEAGFARGLNTNKEPRNYWHETLRNVRKQIQNLQNVKFLCQDYKELSFENCLIYCDPPYCGATEYNKIEKFDHDEFFDWCREQSKQNVVFVSEYNAPEDFKEVWAGEQKTTFASQRKKGKKATEKLFLLEKKQ